MPLPQGAWAGRGLPRGPSPPATTRPGTESPLRARLPPLFGQMGRGARAGGARGARPRERLTSRPLASLRRLLRPPVTVRGPQKFRFYWDCPTSDPLHMGEIRSRRLCRAICSPSTPPTVSIPLGSRPFPPVRWTSFLRTHRAQRQPRWARRGCHATQPPSRLREPACAARRLARPRRRHAGGGARRGNATPLRAALCAPGWGPFPGAAPGWPRAPGLAPSRERPPVGGANPRGRGRRPGGTQRTAQSGPPPEHGG
mmetsp:Transcript_25012/g.79259  ORF Transcript_25012/g.79259 Transcript_25012/m.79259 type:complete len:256 (+) Transcript_25012:234-1001(+)